MKLEVGHNPCTITIRSAAPTRFDEDGQYVDPHNQPIHSFPTRHNRLSLSPLVTISKGTSRFSFESCGWWLPAYGGG